MTMEPHICLKEGIEVNLQDAEDTCPYCNGAVKSVNDIEIEDWLKIIEDIKEGKNGR